MSYSPTSWVDGTTPVNASNLNHLEGGVADLEAKMPVRVYVTQTAARTANFEYTNVSVTIPANSVFVICGAAYWGNMRAAAVGLSESSTSWSAANAAAYAETPIDGGGIARCVLAGSVSAETTYYLWGQWVGENSSPARIEGFYFSY